uniref:Amino acid transporter n=1 Tax=Romanomermis culicivorax TaxID=13658 RepID=A0A915IJG5_ROMCU
MEHKQILPPNLATSQRMQIFQDLEDRTNDDHKKDFLTPLTKAAAARNHLIAVKNRRMAPCWRRLKSLKKETWLLIITVVAIFIGVALGLSLRAATAASGVTKDDEGIEKNVTVRTTWTKRQLTYLKFPGELFLRMLQMLILPLIVSSIVSSLAQMNMTTAGRLGLFTMAYYFATTAIAVVEGIILVNVIKPGRWSEGYKPKDLEQDSTPCMSTAMDTILDLIR